MCNQDLEQKPCLEFILLLRRIRIGRQIGHEKYTIEGTMGIVTDSNFMEGIIEGMKELDDLADSDYVEMAVSFSKEFPICGL